MVLDSKLIRFSNSFNEIQETCPNITSLDLSRNLFAWLQDVAEICAPLSHLKTLRLTGNRFWNLSVDKTCQNAFARIDWLALNMCVLTWDEVGTIVE